MNFAANTQYLIGILENNGIILSTHGAMSFRGKIYKLTYNHYPQYWWTPL